MAISDFTWANMAQLTVNGVISGSSYALVAVGFGMIIHITHRFHIAYASIYALTAFLAAQLQMSYDMPILPALIISTLLGVVLAIAMDRVVYDSLAKRLSRQGRSVLFPVFIVSLGLATAIEALINIIWDYPVGLIVDITGISWGPIFVTNIAVVSVLVTWTALGAVAVLLKWTKLGRMIRAVRVNAPLSVDFGIVPRNIFMIVFAIGTTLGGIGAVLTASQSAPQSNMGTVVVMFAITAAFIAGPSRPPLVIGLFALLIGIIQSWSLIFVAPLWSQFVIFAILLLFVVGKSARNVNWDRVFGRRPAVGSLKPDRVPELPVGRDSSTGAAGQDGLIRTKSGPAPTGAPGPKVDS